MREAAMFTSLARTTGSVDQAAIQRSTPVRPHETTRSQPPTPLDLTLVPPKRHSENVDGALDLSVKKTKAASEDDVSDDVIIVCMQQAPARYGTGPGRVASYYGSELATKGRPQECGQVFSSGTRARSLNALCTSSPHKRRSSSQVEFLRRWSREPGVNICAQAPPRLAESEAGHAYERSSESQPHRQAARESTTRPGCEYLGRDVLPFVPTSSQQLLQQQLLQQQHHMQLLKQQHQQQQKLQRHPDMLNRSRCSPAVCLSPAVSLSPALPTNRLSPQLFVGVDVNSRVPNKSAQVNATRRPHPGSSTYGLLYEKTLPPHSFHTAHDLHNGPYSMIPPTMGDNTRCLYANEKEHARPSSHCVPKPHRDRSTSSERPLSTAEVEQHIRKSLDHAVSLVQTPRVPLRQNRVSSDSSLFPVRPEVDTLRCGTSSSALYHAMLNGSEPIGQPKVATPTGSVPLAKPRDGATKKPPESVVFRSPERVPRSRGDGMAPSKRTVPPPLLYSPHLCLSDSHPAVSGRRSAEHMRMAIGADHFDHRGLVSSGGVLRGSDTSAGDRARCGQALPHSIPEATHGVDVTSPGTSTQGRELEQLRHAPYLLSMLTSQKAELSSSSEQYDHMIGIVRRRDATPAGGICVAGPQDRYVGPYAVPAQHADNRSRGKHQLASCKRSDPRPTNTSNNVVPHPETTSSLTSGKTTHYHRRGSGVDTHVPTDGDAHGRGSAQHTLPSGIRYYKCPTSTKPFTKLPTGDLVSVDKFPSKPIPVANVNPIVKSAYKSGVRAAEYDEKMAGSGSATGDFSRVSASTFTSGVLATTGSGDTTTNSCADGVDANNDVAKKAVTAKTEYSHKDAPNKCAVGVSVHKSVHQSRPSKEPPPTKEAYLCSRRDLALYLSTPKGRQKLKLRDNMSNAGDSCKPTTKSEDYLVADDQTILGVDAPQCGDVKPLGGETLSDFCLSTNEKLSAKTNAYSDLNNTHQPLRDCATIDSDRKPDTKSTFATASPNGDNSAVCTKSDVNKRFATDASLPRGQQPDKFITRKSRILESIRKKSGQQVARQSRQRPEKSVKRGKQTEVRTSGGASSHVYSLAFPQPANNIDEVEGSLLYTW